MFVDKNSLMSRRSKTIQINIPIIKGISNMFNKIFLTSHRAKNGLNDAEFYILHQPQNFQYL